MKSFNQNMFRNLRPEMINQFEFYFNQRDESMNLVALKNKSTLKQKEIVLTFNT